MPSCSNTPESWENLCIWGIIRRSAWRHWREGKNWAKLSRSLFICPQLPSSQTSSSLGSFSQDLLWFHFCPLWGPRARKVRSKVLLERWQERVYGWIFLILFFFFLLTWRLLLTRWNFFFAAKNCCVKKIWHFTLWDIHSISNTSILRWRECGVTVLIWTPKDEGKALMFLAPGLPNIWDKPLVSLRNQWIDFVSAKSQ